MIYAPRRPANDVSELLADADKDLDASCGALSGVSSNSRPKCQGLMMFGSV
jgi:hypothetical protein